MHYERKEVCSHMGLFVNPDQSAFQSALNAQIYVDKSGLIEYTNSVLELADKYWNPEEMYIVTAGQP
mgnify:CR=1 FL=1